MKVIVFTSDKYLELLKDFSYLFNKHWGAEQKVEVLGFTPPGFNLPDNFNFNSAGKQSDFPAGAFCQPFRPILDAMDTEVFIFMIEDAFLIDTVDKNLLNKGLKLLEDKEASKIELFLGADYHYASALPFSEDFKVFPQDMDYRYTSCQCMVRKEYYFKYFNRPTIWQLEGDNIPLSKNDGHTLLVSRYKPIAPWLNVIDKGKFNSSQHAQMLATPGERKFGWNKFQKLNEEEYEIFLKYKDWEA